MANVSDQNIVKLFQTPVSANIDQVQQLQAALNRVRDKAGDILAAAPQASNPGHAEIGAAAGQLASAFGNAQSTSAPEVLSQAQKAQGKIDEHANNLGPQAAEAKRQSENLVVAIQKMVDLWAQVHDRPSLIAAINQTTSVANDIATFLNFLGFILVAVPPLSLALRAAAGLIVVAANITKVVASDAKLPDAGSAGSGGPGGSGRPGSAGSGGPGSSGRSGSEGSTGRSGSERSGGESGEGSSGESGEGSSGEGGEGSSGEGGEGSSGEGGEGSSGEGGEGSSGQGGEGGGGITVGGPASEQSV